MKAIAVIFAAMLTIFVSGCANKQSTTTSTLPDLKIGVLADTQLTTKHRTSGYLFRNMAIDALVNVAIRTTAQEHLAGDHLTILLNDLAEHKPDFILYLGDAANSGCRDEIDTFFQILRSHRESSGLPIFVATGNHDYLATGNQASPKARRQACDDRPYLTKQQLIEELSSFNQESAKLGTFSFIDSKTNSTDAIDKACASSEEMQQISGCYYSAVLSYTAEDQQNVEILITDTSDYKDLRLLPAFSEYFAFFGLRGSISWNKGQADWFESNTNTKTDLRVIASHYPVTDLGWTRFYMGRPGDLMLDNGENVWLSAHTHQKIIESKGETLFYGKDDEGYKRVVHYNIGSTTDFIPQFAVVDMSKKNEKVEIHPSMTDTETSECRNKLLSESGLNQARAEYLLGLDKSYRKFGYDHKKIRENIDKFLENFNETDKVYWTKCLINLASINENKKKRRKSVTDF